MAVFTRRDGFLLRRDSSSSEPRFASSYTVTAYEIGGQVASVSSGTTVTLRSGHGFAALDKLLLVSAGTFSLASYRTVNSVTATTIVLNSALTVAVGDYVFNLGPDAGGASPSYNASPVLTYVDMGGITVNTESRVTVDTNGNYVYWYDGREVWELVRDTAGTPVGLSVVPVIGAPGAVLEASSFATSGAGTLASPWVTSGSNPIQAALNALPDTGGTVHMTAGYFDLGTADPAVTIPITTSATDTRRYSLIGAGRDETTLTYRGTGTAIRYWQSHTGTPGESIQSNNNVLQDFSLRQSTNPRQGQGLWINYGVWWVIRNVSFGTRKSERAAGDHGFAYGIRLDEQSGGYQTVDDFMTIDGCYFSGNTHALKSNQQGDNMRLVNNYFEGNPNVAQDQDGVEIKNASGIKISGNAFNFFTRAGMHGIKLSTDISGVEISGNYFEGNANAIYLNSDGNQDGIHIHGNQISLDNATVAGSYGIRAGLDSASFKIRGLVIGANTFNQIGVEAATQAGIRIGSDVRGYLLLGNRYDVVAGTNNLIVDGSSGIILESPPNAAAEADDFVSMARPYFGSTLTRGSTSELISVATGVTFQESTANLLPANSYIEAVVARPTVLAGGTTSFNIGDPVSTSKFTPTAGVISTTPPGGAGTVCLDFLQPQVASSALGPIYLAATKIRLTFNTTTNNASGRIRVTVYWRQVVAHQS